jgi:hypothetical protein
MAKLFFTHNPQGEPGTGLVALRNKASGKGNARSFGQLAERMPHRRPEQSYLCIRPVRLRISNVCVQASKHCRNNKDSFGVWGDARRYNDHRQR